MSNSAVTSPPAVLYIVGTPIGNLEDITLRALRILGEVDLIAAEDTRTTKRLLSHYKINTPLISYHEFSTDKQLARLVERMQTQRIALVSDAGMPGISDPGYRLVRAAVDAAVLIVPIPGPSATLAALVGSGLPTDKFLFLGFLPRQKAARCAALKDVSVLPYTLVAYESPHRVLALLADIVTVLGAERPVVVGRELTKQFEEFVRGTAGEVHAHFAANPIRGEFTLVIGGAEPEATIWTEQAVRQAMIEHSAQGMSRKQAATAVAALSGWRKRDVYNLSIDTQA